MLRLRVIGLSLLSPAGVESLANSCVAFSTHSQQFVCLCPFLTQNTVFASGLMLTALSFGEGSSGSEWISTLLMVPYWPKENLNTLPGHAKPLRLLTVFSFIASLTWQLHQGCRTTHEQSSRSRILISSFHFTSFVYAQNAFFAFSTWLIPNSLFLPNLNHKLPPVGGFPDTFPE